MSEEPPSCDVVVEVGWCDLAVDLEQEASHVAATVLRHLDVDPAGVELGVRFADDDALMALNRDWRGHDTATDVLAFPATDPTGCRVGGMPLLLGDVIIAAGVSKRDAERLGRPWVDHLRHLLVHGMLHLFHYDHATPEQAGVMEPLEVRILADLGVADPYRDAQALEERP